MRRTGSVAAFHGSNCGRSVAGRRLEEHGFGIGSVMRVQVEHGRLTLISEAAEG